TVVAFLYGSPRSPVRAAPAAPLVSSDQPAREPHDEPVASATAAATVDAASPVAAVASAAAPAATTTTTPRVAKPPSRVKPDCQNPYTVDSVGHTHFRKECL